MSALELELPLHLYTEKKDPHGIVTGLNYSADKLVAWADHGKGNAVTIYVNRSLRGILRP